MGKAKRAHRRATDAERWWARRVAPLPTLRAAAPLHSRGAMRPSFSINHPHREQRAQGRPGALRTHGPRATKKHAAEPQVRAGTPGLPCAMVLRLIRDLPGDQALLSPLPRVISQNVTPALGRQDHTTSPSASCCSSNNTPRPSHPASNVRDDREAPLLW